MAGLIRMLTVLCPACGRNSLVTFPSLKRDPRCGYCGARVTDRNVVRDDTGNRRAA